MSKLTFIMCAVFFVSTANAIPWSEYLQKYQILARQEIDHAIWKVKAKWDDALVEEILHETDNIHRKLSDAESNNRQHENIEISKIAERAKGIDVNECFKSFDDIGRDVQRIVKAMRECISVERIRQLQDRRRGIDAFAMIIHEVLGGLSNIQKDADRCHEGIDSLTRAVEAISCIRTAAAEATRISDLFVVVYPFREAEWNMSMTVSRGSLFNVCAAISGYSTIDRHYQGLAGNVTKCIEYKIAEDETTTVSSSVSTGTPESPRTLHWIPDRI